jgi:diacylglycerol kinase
MLAGCGRQTLVTGVAELFNTAVEKAVEKVEIMLVSD